MQSASQLVEKPLFGEKAFRFAGGVRGGRETPRVESNACKRLLPQAFAPHSGSFLDCEADKKARHCVGCRKSPADFFDSLTCRGAHRLPGMLGMGDLPPHRMRREVFFSQSPSAMR